jgi:hypothetical protein
MQFGFISLHPVSVPFGNDFFQALGNVYSYGLVLYVGVIKPEVIDVLSVLDVL